MEANIEELRLRRINSLGNGLKRQIAYPNGEIIIDVEDKTILLNDKVYKFCDIIDCNLSASVETDASIEFLNAYNEVKQARESKPSTGEILGRSLVGGVIGGAPGAIIGGLSSKKDVVTPQFVDPKYNNFSVIVTIDDVMCPQEVILIGRFKERAFEILNSLKVIINSNKSKDAEQHFDKKKIIEDLYTEARTEKSLLKSSSSEEIISSVGILYEQLYINDTDSPEAKFYHFYFSVFISDKYAHKFGMLYQGYLKEFRNYVAYLQTISSPIPDNIMKILVHDTFIYAKKLSGGYIDEIHFGYQLLLKIGDLLYKLSVNKQYAVELWKDGVKLHHENELTQKKEDLSEYVDKIKQIESSYIEPKIKKLNNIEGWTMESCGGCLVGLAIIGFLIYVFLS